MSKDIKELITFSTEERPIKGFALESAIYVADTKQSLIDEQTKSNDRVAGLVAWARDAKKFIVFSEDGSSYEEKDQPSGEGNPYRDVAVMDKVESVGFDEEKKARIDKPDDQRFMFVDIPNRLYNTGEVEIFLDSSKPIGAIQLENFCNYNWDYPELIIKIYVDNTQTYLGGFRIPYGFGVIMKYNLDNKSESNLSKGWWTWSMFGVDWSIINKVASIDGEFSSVAVAYNGLFGDEGEGDERVFYPAMMKQDENGDTKFDFTGDLQITYKDKDTNGVESESVLTITSEGVKFNKPINGKGQLNTLEVAYRGEYGEGASYESVKLNQDLNGWTQLAFTGNMLFKTKNKSTGDVGDTVFELHGDRVVHKKQPYYGDNRLASRTGHHIDNTYSFADLIHSSGKNINEWITENTEYTPAELLDAIFDSKVLGNSNWILSATTSNNDYNGTFPTGYQQIELHRTGGSARNFMRAYNKESPTHYYAPHKTGKDPDWKTYTYKEDIPAIIDKEIEPLDERVTNLESGSGADKAHVDSEFKFPDSPEDGYTQYVAGLSFENKLIRGQPFSVAKITNETKGALAFAVVKKSDQKFWMGFHAELIDDLIGAEIAIKRPNLGIVFDGSRINVCMDAKNTPGTGIMNWEGYCIPKGMDANDDNPSRYIMPDGSQTTVKEDSFTRVYMDWSYNQRETFKHSDTGFVEDWKYRLSRGYIAENFTFIPDESSPYYFCRMQMGYSVGNNKLSTLSFKGGTFSIYQSPRGAIADREGNATTSQVTEMIAGNNDEILTPENGSDFTLTDTRFDSGYGLNGNVTYIGISKTEGQSTVLVNHLDQSRCYFTHKAHNTTSGFMMLHESLVAEIYGKDLTGVNELVMLFGPKSKGRLGKSNQKAPDGYIWNWNGEAVPDTVSANEINPGNWLDKDGNPTTTWSSSVLSACFSVGTLTNVGSAALVRGDVMFDDDTATTSMTVLNDSEFFVMPVKTGGGTFADIKLFQLFMGRRSGTQNDFDAYTFDKSADAIGTLLRISYDAAVQVEEVDDKIQTELFKMAAATVAEHPVSNFVINTGE